MSIPSSLDASFVLVDGVTSATGTPAAIVTQKFNTALSSHPSNDLGYVAGSTSSYAHDWSKDGTGGKLRTHGRHFIDAYGRVCSLRGVNLSGSSKAPVNHDNYNFPGNPKLVTFVGRPFPLEEAHEHFSRLRRWGFSFLRFLVTWEAVEHEGPGVYDKEYLDYLRNLLSLLPKYGLTAFVALHQDVWSRYSGGSGAPAWTLEAVGFELQALEETGAAWLAGMRGGGQVKSEQGLWPCGYQKLAASTMATCFWAGDVYSPKLSISDRRGNNVSIQQFLQNAFLDMYDVLARSVGDIDGVLGFEMMNEPHRGYIDLQSLHSFDYNTDLHLSHIPSAFQSFQLGAGHPTVVPTWTRSFPMPTRKTSKKLLNKNGQKVWQAEGPTGGLCLWEMHNVWKWDLKKDQAVVLRENYFNQNPVTGGKVDWYTDFYFPLLEKWASRVRKVAPDKIVFVEAIPNEFCPKSWTEEHKLHSMVYAPHWYDLNALFAKAFGDFSVNVQGLSRGMFPLKAFYWGQKGARDNFKLQIRNIVEHAYDALGETPVIVGECGIPMDMNSREAFETGDFTWQARMMDAMMTGLEEALIGFTLWNYNPLNNDIRGDDWNGENFSWFSRSRALPPSLLFYEQNSPSLDNGGRILSAIVRPYPAKTAGIPIQFNYEMTTGAFIFTWANRQKSNSLPSNSIAEPPLSGLPPITAFETEIFLPSQLAHGRKVIVEGLSDTESYRYDESRQTLYILSRDKTPGKTHSISVSLEPPLQPPFEVNHFWGDFGARILSFFVVVMAILTYWVLLLRSP